MIENLAIGAGLFLWAPAFSWMALRWSGLRPWRRYFIRIWISAAVGGLAFGAIAAGFTGGGWAGPAGSAASLIVALAIWWWRRKKRRSVAAMLGAKSRALRDALVRRARQVARPRPVLRPVPGGAR
jgi:hypothetical protein